MPRYLPSLSTLITPDNIPSSIGFIQDITEAIFDDIYFDHYHSQSDDSGEYKGYNLDIILDKQIGFTVPGVNLTLLINPNDDLGMPQSTSINVMVSFRFEILKLAQKFDLNTFSFSNEDFMNLLLNIVGINESLLLSELSSYIKNSIASPPGYSSSTVEEMVPILNSFYELTGTADELIFTVGDTFSDIEDQLIEAGIAISQVISDFQVDTDYPLGLDTIEDVFSKVYEVRDYTPMGIEAFIDLINSDFLLSGTPDEIIYTAVPETTYDDILVALENADISLAALIILYLIPEDASFSEAEQALILFYIHVKKTSYPQDYLNLLIPNIKFSINDINLVIEFPRTVLIPIDTTIGSPTYGQPIMDEAVKSRLKFDAGDLEFNSNNGLSFSDLINISFNKSQIGNTGICLEFSDLKVDFSHTSNVSEISEAGYSNDFMGVYIGEAIISLPTFWIKNDGESTAEIKGKDLIIGTGGFSGLIYMYKPDESALVSTNLGSESGFIVELDAFDITFLQNAIINSRITGTISIPKFTDSENNPLVINVAAHIGTDGDFEITATEPESVVFNFLDVFTIKIKSLSIGNEDDRFYCEVSGSLSCVYVFEELGDVLPKEIEIKKLRIWDDGTIEFVSDNAGGSIVIAKIGEIDHPAPI